MLCGMALEQPQARTWLVRSHGSVPVLLAVLGVLLIFAAGLVRIADLRPRMLSGLNFVFGATALLWSGRRHRVSARLEEGTLEIGRRLHIELLGWQVSYGRYVYPLAGQLGTVLWLRSGRQRLRIGGMNVLLDEDECTAPDSFHLDFSMEGDAFQDFQRVLAAELARAGVGTGPAAGTGAAVQRAACNR